MKIPVVIFHFSLISALTFGQQNHGQISGSDPGNIRISYPAQTIDVSFDYMPSNGVQHFTSKTDLNQHEKLRVVGLMKQQIDQLPASFVNKYLDVEILPMHINGKSEFGYNLDRQIIVEVEKIKQGMSYQNSVKSALAHQIAYLLMDDPTSRESVQDIQNYLNSLNQTFSDTKKHVGYSIYEQGFVSRYASGEISGNYHPSTEFAELFAHLTCEENRADLINFINDQPENILSIKVRRFIDYLAGYVAGFDRDYFYPSEVEAYTTPTPTDQDGGVLLSIHELRSYESLDFDAMEDQQKVWSNTDEGDVYEELPTNSWEQGEPEVAHEVLSYSEQSSSFGPHDAQSKETSKKKKKKKTRRGLLIAGAAIYVLLQIAN
jgi:hypothetical protein